jgi:hypothetical protein
MDVVVAVPSETMLLIVDAIETKAYIKYRILNKCPIILTNRTTTTFTTFAHSNFSTAMTKSHNNLNLCNNSNNKEKERGRFFKNKKLKYILLPSKHSQNGHLYEKKGNLYTKEIIW